jgi:hypothetical protein
MNENMHRKPQRASPEKESCTQCASVRARGALFCPYCGRTLVEPSGVFPKTPAGKEHDDSSAKPNSELPEPNSPQGAPSVNGVRQGFREMLATEGIDYCGHCEWELPDNARFCPGCASSLNPSAEAKFWIHQIHADGLPTPVPISGEQFTIGQAEDCDLQLKEDGFVSRRHARLRRENDLLFLEDLGSSNGTLLRIRRPIIVEPGDEILVGTSVLRVGQRGE